MTQQQPQRPEWPQDVARLVEAAEAVLEAATTAIERGTPLGFEVSIGDVTVLRDALRPFQREQKKEDPK